MKQKLKIGILLWSLLFALGTIGLSGCDKDDEHFGDDVYQGYVQETTPGALTIKVTYSPYDHRETNLHMPHKNELIMYGFTPDSQNLELKVDQKLSFQIISAEWIDQFVPFNYPPKYPLWRCEIKIIKLY